MGLSYERNDRERRVWSPRAPLDPSLRRRIYGPIEPMEPRSILERIFSML